MINRRGVSAVTAAIALVGLAGAALVVAAELSNVLEIRAAGVVVESRTGLEQHGGALLALAASAVVLILLGPLGGNRVAMAGLAVVGAVVLGIALVVDLPDVNQAGALEDSLSSAQTAPGAALWLELSGAVLLLVSAGASLLSQRGEGGGPKGGTSKGSVRESGKRERGTSRGSELDGDARDRDRRERATARRARAPAPPR